MKKTLALLFLLGFCATAFAVELPAINKSKIRLTIPAGNSNQGEIYIENTTGEAGR